MSNQWFRSNKIRHIRQKMHEWHEISQGPLKALKGEAWIVSWFDLDKAIHPNQQRDSQFSIDIIGFDEEFKMDKKAEDNIYADVEKALTPIWSNLVEIKHHTFRHRVQSFGEQLDQLKLEFDAGMIDESEYNRKKLEIYDQQQVLLQTAVLDGQDEGVPDRRVQGEEIAEDANEEEDEDMKSAQDEDMESEQAENIEIEQDDSDALPEAEIAPMSVNAPGNAQPNQELDRNGIGARRSANAGNARERRAANIGNDIRGGAFVRNGVEPDRYARNNRGAIGSVRNYRRSARGDATGSPGGSRYSRARPERGNQRTRASFRGHRRPN